MIREIIRIVHRATAPLRHQVNAMVSRVVVDAINNASKCQQLKVVALADEVLDDVEHFQPGGLTHHPLNGAEGVIVCVGGDRDHAIALGVANRSARPTGGAPGETVLYSASPGTAGIKIKLLANGDIELTPTATVTIKGALVVNGDVTAGAATSPITLLTHLHPTGMGPSSAPTAPPAPP
jgi:phage gp45-like